MAETRKVNEVLKSRREQRRLSVQSVHQETRISREFLEAMEAGRWDAFPAEVYCQGFLRRYAAFLGLDPEETLRLYRSELDAVKAGQAEMEKRTTSTRRKEQSAHFNRIVVFMGLLAVIGGLWLYSLMSPAKGPVQPPPAAPAAAPILSGSAPPVRLTLRVRSLSRSWLRVSSNGTLRFEGFISSGSVRIWESEDRFLVSAKDPGQVSLWLNGEPIDPWAARQGDGGEVHIDSSSIAREPPQ